MEPEDLLPCSQEPAIDPYPEPDESNPHPLTLFPKIHFNIPPIYASVFRFVSSLQAFQQKFCVHFSSPHARFTFVLDEALVIST
jgi:hypothetical protein